MGGGAMTITANQVELAIARVEPPCSDGPNGLALMAEAVNGELSAWGHAGHEVTLERVLPFFGDPGVLSWHCWCETCHVSQLVLLARPEAV